MGAQHKARAILRTWKRVEYAEDRVDELVLVKSGVVGFHPMIKSKVANIPLVFKMR